MQRSFKLGLFFLLALLSLARAAQAAYVDNGDTVTDTVTGLEWQKATALGTYTWQAALAYCEGLTLAEKSDWRLPDRNELRSLVDYSRYSPAIDPVFAATTQLYYWSSTTHAADTSRAWLVGFDTGTELYGTGKSDSYYVRAVRGGQVGPSVISGVTSIPVYSTSNSSSTGAGPLAPVSNNLSFHADPVNVASGSHVLERQLLSVSGVQPIALTARYDSLLLAQGPMGKGWGHNFETSLEILVNNDVRVHWNVNRASTFINDGSNNFSATETAIKFDTLVKNGDATYTLTRKDGSVYQFNTSGKLTQQKKRIGQQLDMAYDGNNRLATVTEPVSGKALSFSYTAAGLLETVIDPLNHQVSFTYDASNNLVTITDPNSKTVTYSYNSDGRVLTAVDAEGNTLFTNTYDIHGRVAAQDDALASTTQLTSFNYDEITQAGMVLTTVTERTGATKTLTHDSSYNLIQIKDQLGAITSFAYDVDGNRLTATDANGKVTSYTHDARGNVLTITDTKGRVTAMTYDAHDNLLTITNSDAKTVTYTYDANNRVTSIKNPFNQSTSYTYNANGQVTTAVDPKNGVTTYSYTNGMLASITNPAGDITGYAYDTAGRVTGITNPAGKTSTMEYDALGNLVKIIDPLGRQSSLTYDSHGHKLTTTDPKGNVTAFDYNGNGKLISITNPLNQITNFVYDPEDRLIGVIDGRGNTNMTGFDVAGRPLTVTDALNNTVTSAYDAVGNLVTRKDAYGTTILSATYDSDTYVPLTVKDALLNTVTYGYDALDRVATVLNPLNQVSQNSYDALNRLVSVVDPRNGTASQSFDANGNRVTAKDPNNNQTTFTHDASNRLTGITSATGGTQGLAYANGRLASTVNARNQATTYTYYDDGRIQTVTNPAGVITYTYDANGNVLTVSESGKTISYVNDALNRVVQYTDGDNNVILYAYDEVGNLASLTYPGGQAVTYTYDAVNRLVTVTDWDGRVTGYTYDKNGSLLTTTRPDGSVETRAYNSAGQLTQLKDTKADTTIISKYDFTYDATGNVTAEVSAGSEPVLSSGTETMTYGADNRLATYQGQAVSYDADGNMTSGPLGGSMQSFSYDARNLLTAAAGATYLYDANNNRIALTVGGQTTKFVVNPMAALSQTLMEKDGSGNVKARYVYGLGLIGRQDVGGFKVYHFDRRGSVEALTDMTGAITDSYTYDPYGATLSHVGSTVQPFQYNGRDGVMNDANGLCYMRVRYYNQTVRRFINMDSLLGEIVDGQTLNRYAYVNGNPVDRIDPTGQSYLKAAGYLAVAVAGGVALVVTAPATLTTGGIVLAVGSVLTISGSFAMGTTELIATAMGRDVTKVLEETNRGLKYANPVWYVPFVVTGGNSKVANNVYAGYQFYAVVNGGGSAINNLKSFNNIGAAVDIIGVADSFNEASSSFGYRK